MDSKFDKYVQSYAQIHNRNIRISGETLDYFAEYKVKILDQFYTRHRISKEIKILDLGCGIGKIEYYLFHYFPKARVWGMDISQESINYAGSSNTSPQAFFEVFNGKDIPLSDGVCQAVILACVLHHVQPDQRNRLLSEIYRVLDKGKYLFIFDHNLINPLTRLVVSHCEFDQEANFLGIKETVTILEGTGWSIVEKRYISFFPRLLWFLRSCESYLSWFPLGAQYFIAATKRHD
jgi:ubiquinone/menaquinone biosynthesis C-methylase UbiE